MLKAALDRLQSTTVATSIRQPAGRRLHRFSWINEWKELAGRRGRAYGIELILADWFYAGVLDNALVLTLDPAYFQLTGGIERWLYRLVRKHGGWQRKGWRFDFRHLHLKSGSLQRYSDFALHLRQLALRQPLPGYRLSILREGGAEVLAFRIAVERSLSTADGESAVDKLCSDSGIARTEFGESPANDSGNHPHGSAATPDQPTLCGLLNSSN
jgi:plasmid replication initiation protein